MLLPAPSHFICWLHKLSTSLCFYIYILQVFMTFLPNKTPKLAIIACLLIVSVVEIEIISAMFA